jgi:polyhydroxyalkanoate synthesis regulator phasin
MRSAWYNQGMVTKRASGDTLGDLATRGQETLHRITELPGGTTALKAFNDLRTRVDDLGKRVRGIDALEARVTKLEKEVAALKRAQKPAPKAPARKGT